eukprot:403783-Rhodomonas_salina.3
MKVISILDGLHVGFLRQEGAGAGDPRLERTFVAHVNVLAQQLVPRAVHQRHRKLAIATAQFGE